MQRVTLKRKERNVVSSFNLDTRRDRIALTVDLNDCLDINKFNWFSFD